MGGRLMLGLILIVIFYLLIATYLFVQSGAQAEIIPREVLFGNPERSSPRISPDGTQLAYVAPLDGVMNIWVCTLGSTDDHPVTSDKKRGISSYFWQENSKHILYVQYEAGDENWRLYSVEVTTQMAKLLTPAERVQTRILAHTREHPDELLILLNKRNPEVHDVYHLDLNTYIAWSTNLVQNGFKSFFQNNWVDYLPGYPYLLWLLGNLKIYLNLSPNTNLLLYKLPAIFADLASGTLIFFILKKKHKQVSLIAAAAFLFNPAIFANSTLWGQTDSFTALFALATLFTFLNSKPIYSGLSLGLGSLVKLNTLFILPILVFFQIQTQKHIRPLAILIASAVTIFALAFIPFQNQPNLASFIQSRIHITTNQYQLTSLNAFNVWFLREGSWQSDQTHIAGITKHNLGNLLFLISLALVFTKLKSIKKITLAHLSLSTALSFFSAFMFLTRMHERHLLAALPFLAIAAALKPKYWKHYAFLSISYLLNLIFAYQLGSGNIQILSFPPSLPKLLSLFNLIILTFLFRSLTYRSSRPQKISRKHLLFLLLAASFIIRVTRLNVPNQFHFDEVYHAFTAQEMLKGNVAAWEWWNTPPEGVAYEWTHPPLSKHFMVLSMQIFGQNPFAFRFPGVIFGVANIYLVFLLAKKLLPKNNNLPLLATALYSLETLSFVQSRIAMNDTYMLFFILVALYSLLQKKYPASAFSFALALATKWSAIYTAPLLLVAFILYQKPKFTDFLKIGIWYLIIPLNIYLVVYLPFFTSGHSWPQFIQLQKQMYWYHTRLVATHDYSSPWWSWPLMLRPVWYFVKYQDNLRANIYALGNPFVFWGGLVALIYSISASFREWRVRRLSRNGVSIAILLTGYLAFLLPWSLSPRIMFLYHYLPSIPFMVIILAWAVLQIYQSGTRGQLLVTCYLLLVAGAFLLLYPHLTALPIHQNWSNLYYLLPSWR